MHKRQVCLKYSPQSVLEGLNAEIVTEYVDGWGSVISRQMHVLNSNAQKVLLGVPEQVTDMAS